MHVVIIGLTHASRSRRKSDYLAMTTSTADPVESRHVALSAYLFDASAVANKHLVVEERSRPLCDVPRLMIGTQPIDDGNYIFDEAARAAFIAAEPGAKSLLHPYIGSVEYINGLQRWILCLKGASPAALRKLPLVLKSDEFCSGFLWFCCGGNGRRSIAR